MREKLLPLATTTWDDNEINAAVAVLQSGSITMGEQVNQFESSFADFFGSKYAVMVNSGSSANLLLLNSLLYLKENPLQPGDEVIVPSLSWPTTYYPVNQCGLKLVFVDIDLFSLNIATEEIEKALSPKVKAIFVPNILGNPANLIKLQQLCDAHHLYLLEDNCESMGATIAGKAAGTFGIGGTFSTYFSHHISTIEGGVVVTDNEELYHIMLSIRSHGWTRHLPENNCLVHKNENSFYDAFRFILPGYNIRSTEVAAAIGSEQLKKLPDIIQGRRRNAKKFVELFGVHSSVLIQQEHGCSSWFGFSLICENQKRRDLMVQALTEIGVDVRPIVAGCILEQEVIKHMNYRIVGNHDNAKKAHYHGLFIGNHHYDVSVGLERMKSILTVTC